MTLASIDIDSIDIGDRLRNARADQVRAIAASIVDVGLLNPITVHALDGDRYGLIAGLHRFEACRLLGLAEIEANVLVLGDLERQIAECDENLCAPTLTAVERARFTARRKQAYEALHPETRPTSEGGGGRNNDTRRQLGDESVAERFTADTAAATGKSERAVQRDAERGEKIAEEALDLVERTDLDKGAYLDRLKGLPEEEQVETVKRDLVRGNRAIMADRREPDDSLDYFPTPPWATRTLIEDVVPRLANTLPNYRVWEPACGEGHMSGVLAEYCRRILATDIFDYSAGGISAPGWDRTVDFLKVAADAEADWIITNPPFGDNAIEFALKALSIAQVGVALFVRQQWLEGVERYERLFRDHPPTVVAQFSERVPLCKGRWEPEGSTATAYCWLVWERGWLAKKPIGLKTEFVWIRPGRRAERSRPDDVERFTAHPVLPPRQPSTAAAGELGQSNPAPDSQAKASEGNGATGPDMELPADRVAGEPSRGVGARSPTATSERMDATAGETAINSNSAEAETLGGGAGEPRAEEGSHPISDADEIIRAGYAVDRPLAEIAAETGLRLNIIKYRARRMGLSNPARQRERSRENALRQHAERRKARGTA